MSLNKRPAVRYEPMTAKTILNSVKAPSMPFDWSINPYRGCQHGCSFCYARSTHSFLGVDTDDTFQHHIFLKQQAPEVLRAQILKRLRGRKGISDLGQVAIGTATDPYQQIEGKARLTRGCLEVLAEFQIPVTITTRSPLILRDLDILQRLSSITVNVSISTLNPVIWRQFEPSTPSPAKRLDMVEQLRNAGVDAGVFAAPILPYITDDQAALEDLIRAVSAAGAQFVMPSYLRLSTQAVKVWFFQTLQRHYPRLIGDYARLYQASGSAPAEFRDPVMRRIETLLHRHGLQSRKGAARAPQMTIDSTSGKADANEKPVQLTLF
ncbi:SPL family radical SAM protein [Paenibacillus piri]|uniref:Radical SAM protein n=1 Tax=Paenibacillus piri TaxID=2547395 RepID=A0A4R5KNC0_9BACL|nr:radical SAM protein [Paenibacillus piri]TDF97153.1 radical SAM protein [Paenibacillus piri]